MEITDGSMLSTTVLFFYSQKTVWLVVTKGWLFVFNCYMQLVIIFLTVGKLFSESQLLPLSGKAFLTPSFVTKASVCTATKAPIHLRMDGVKIYRIEIYSSKSSAVLSDMVALVCYDGTCVHSPPPGQLGWVLLSWW